MRKWRQENAEKIKEYRKHYYQNHAEKLKEQMKQYNKDNAEQIKEYNKQRYKDNTEYFKQYNKTPIGRASNLLNTYNQNDKKYNRGRGDLTSEWIVERIFSQPCVHCGKKGWQVIGCNRIDNSKPHSKDNVEPCCPKCNKNLPRKMGLTSPS